MNTFNYDDFFLDISTNAKTKEEYLSKGCQARIRGYLSKARTQLVATKFDDLLADTKKAGKEDHKKESVSNNRSCRKTNRTEIRRMNESEIVNNGGEDDNFEIFDEENWDEIDATFLQNYRGRLQKRYKLIRQNHIT